MAVKADLRGGEDGGSVEIASQAGRRGHWPAPRSGRLQRAVDDSPGPASPTKGGDLRRGRVVRDVAWREVR
ncbi:hypothetical protein ACWD0J_05435 [Streptomyces sp. NPDC003011]